jgi:hypothetical protein
MMTQEYMISGRGIDGTFLPTNLIASLSASSPSHQAFTLQNALGPMLQTAAEVHLMYQTHIQPIFCKQKVFLYQFAETKGIVIVFPANGRVRGIESSDSFADARRA